jgi:aminopeptidase N
VHEVAHQWWYSMVGNDQTLYPWLDEALTEYSVAVYEGFVGDQAGYDARVGIFRRQFIDFEATFGEVPIGQAVSAYSEDAYAAIVYRKGASFFDNLLQLLGPEAFRAGLQAYLMQYRYRVATPFDFQTVMEQSSGLSLDDWFNLWVGYSN